MIWFLLFCSHMRMSTGSSDICTAPTQMPTQQACHFIGKQMQALDESGSRYQCVAVHKPAK